MSPLNFREALAKSLLAVSAICAADKAFAFKDCEQNAIVLENLKPDTLDWQLTYTRTDSMHKLHSPLIEGFASFTCVTAGETLTSFVGALKLGKGILEIYWLGYYAGKGGRSLAF